MDLSIWRAGCFGFMLLLFCLSTRLKTAHRGAYQSPGLPTLLANAFKGTWTLGVFLYFGRCARL